MKAASSRQQAPNTTARKQAAEAITVRGRSRCPVLGVRLNSVFRPNAAPMMAPALASRKIHDQRRHAGRRHEILRRARRGRAADRRPRSCRTAPPACRAARATAGSGTGRSDSRGRRSTRTSATTPMRQRREDQLLAERDRGGELGLVGPVDVQICGRSLRATCTKPFDQRLCWAPKSSSRCGSSPTTCGSIRNTPVQPLRWVRSTRSRSSDSVSCDQPPASSTAARRQMPPVPLNWNGTPRRARTSCSTAKWASCISRWARVSQLRSPLPHSMRVCTKAARGFGEHRRHRPAQPVRRRHEVGVEHRDDRARRTSAMPAASAPALKPLRSARRTCSTSMPSLAQAVDGVDGDVGGEVGAVVEQLDLEPVARPVERRPPTAARARPPVGSL